MRARHLLLIDAVGILVSAYVALGIRYDRVPGPELVGPFLPILGLLLVVRMLVNARMGLYSRGWRFASIPDVIRIVGAVLAGTITTIALYYTLVLIGPFAGAGFHARSGPPSCS